MRSLCHSRANYYYQHHHRRRRRRHRRRHHHSILEYTLSRVKSKKVVNKAEMAITPERFHRQRYRTVALN